MTPEEEHILKRVHRRSSFNRHELAKVERCGCYYCQKVSLSADVKEFVWDRGFREATAVCPHCSIDSILPGVTSEALLKAMHDFWFGRERSSSMDEVKARIQAEFDLMKKNGWTE